MKYTSTATAIGLVMAAASAAPAFAATQWTFADIDADGNLELAEREFERVSRDAFTRLDTDQNQQLAQNELTAGQQMLGTGGTNAADWDRAGDGSVDWEEFHARLFSTYDADNDRVLNEREFGQFAQADTGTGTATGTATATATVGDRAIQADQIIPLAEWRYDDLYQGGFSVENLMDEVEVYGVDGEEIGDIEDVIFGSDGRVLSVIAEVGGLWDIGDTHVSIPWSRVEFRPARDGIIVPIDEDNLDEYGLFDTEFITADAAASRVLTEVDDDETGPRAWRATELIGDYARLRDNDRYMNYGYINDLIVRDGQLAAVLVNPDSEFGTRGNYAYPYYGYGGGWGPGRPYYDLPYNRDEIGDREPFDYERFEY